jgi:DNA-binding response OmpR family regulator
MDQSVSVLVVESEARELVETADVLRNAGYRVLEASKFEEARQLISDARPALVIAGVRLGAFNGLHLILRSRLDQPNLAAILTNDSTDAVLQQEAERQHTQYLTRPSSPHDLLAMVASSLRSL